MHTHTFTYTCIHAVGRSSAVAESLKHACTDKITKSDETRSISMSSPRKTVREQGLVEQGQEGRPPVLQSPLGCQRGQGRHTLTVSMYSDLLYSSSPNSMAVFSPNLRILSVAQADGESTYFRLPLRFRYSRPPLSSTARITSRQPRSVARCSPAARAQSERRF